MRCAVQYNTRKRQTGNPSSTYSPRESFPIHDTVYLIDTAASFEWSQVAFPQQSQNKPLCCTQDDRSEQGPGIGTSDELRRTPNPHFGGALALSYHVGHGIGAVRMASATCAKDQRNKTTKMNNRVGHSTGAVRLAMATCAQVQKTK